MKAILFFIIFFTTFFCKAQDSACVSNFRDKKWYGKQWKDGNGMIHSYENINKMQYVMFKKDGTYLSTENIKKNDTGYWSYDEKKAILTITFDGTNPKTPKKVSCKIVNCTSNSLCFDREENGEKLTIYLVAY